MINVFDCPATIMSIIVSLTLVQEKTFSWVKRKGSRDTNFGIVRIPEMLQLVRLLHWSLRVLSRWDMIGTMKDSLSVKFDAIPHYPNNFISTEMTHMGLGPTSGVKWVSSCYLHRIQICNRTDGDTEGDDAVNESITMPEPRGLSENQGGWQVVYGLTILDDNISVTYFDLGIVQSMISGNML